LYIEFYRVPIRFRNADGTILGVNLFVDSQTSSLRTGAYFRPTRELLIAAMDERK